MSQTWILLRGLTREHGHWGPFIGELRQALPPGDLILTPDLPGNGLLHLEESPATVERMMHRCRELLADQGHAPPYNVIAMSLGAMVTAAWAYEHPEEVARCVLINTSLRPFSPFWHRLRPRQYTHILKLLLSRAGEASWERAIMRMTTRHPPDAEATLREWLRLRAVHPVSVRNGLRQLWAAARFKSSAQAPKVPVLLLGSMGDQLVHPKCSEALATGWGVPLIRHPTAGHDLPLDAAPWLAREIASWLAESARSARSLESAPSPERPAPHPAA